MGIRIIVDSAADMLETESKYLKVVPIAVTFGTESFLDGINLSTIEFYERLVNSDVLPTTSQPSPFAFEEAIREIIDAGHTPIVITVSSKLSGTYNSARIAAEEFQEKVYVIDSENACLGEKVLVQYAIQLIEQGKSADEIVEAVEREKKHICVLAVLDTLEYLRKGGRISNVSGIVGGMLSIKPIICIKDGVIEALGKARGSKNADKLFTEQIKQQGAWRYDMPYMLAYTGNDKSNVDKYMREHTELWEDTLEEIPIGHVGCAIGTHTGPGAIAVAFFKR